MNFQRRVARPLLPSILLSLLTLGDVTPAFASRLPTKHERALIAQAARGTPHAGNSKVQVSRIRVSTVGPWASATVSINVSGGADEATDILHRVHGRWLNVAVGTAGEWCVMPVKDQRNLGFSASYRCQG